MIIKRSPKSFLTSGLEWKWGKAASEGAKRQIHLRAYTLPIMNDRMGDLENLCWVKNQKL